LKRALGDGFELDDDPRRIDVDAVHEFISTQSYWGLGRPRDVVERTIRGSSRVLGLYRDHELIGFARAVSDETTVAYLADVYVLPAYRGRGLGMELVREIVDGSPGEGVRWLLHTADAQGLYAKLGFTEGQAVYPLMERGRRPQPVGEKRATAESGEHRSGALPRAGEARGSSLPRP
jgi:GNAT superfamily N-acetyltransferase